MSYPGVKLKLRTPTSIREKVYEHLKSQILKTDIPSLTVLVESHLANQIGISRTPVREALHLLAKEGLLERVPRSGYRVRSIDRNEFEEICEIRTMAEVLAANWAIRRIQAEELEVMEKNLATSAKVIESGDFAAFVDLDAQFHDILARASGSQRLIHLINALRNDMIRYRIKSLHNKNTAELALAGHQLIFESLRNQDNSGIENAIREHLNQSKKYILLYAFEEEKNRNAESEEIVP